MNKIRQWLGATICFAVVLMVSLRSTNAAGLLIADGGFGGVLEIKEHDVRVTINNGVAVTEVTQIFLNTEDRQVEALYTFPVPKGASVANFSMWIGGKEMIGEVLEKERAREIYNSYKQVRRDPGLLEQVDYKTFEMRIFPIAAKSEQRVQIVYYQELDFDHDWGNYVYPLATTTHKGIDSKTQGKFAVRLDVKSAAPIVLMESPSHADEFEIVKHADDYFQASLEMNGGSLAKDIVLAYQMKRPRTGFDLIASKRSGEDGHFLLTLTAGEDLARRENGMDYVFVLDVSGSMADDGKLLLSKDSVGAFISELGPEDRFEVMTFNVQPQMAFDALREASDANKSAGIEYLSGQRARGGTGMNAAINTAWKYADADRPLNVVILSDGLTEHGARRELVELIRSRPGGARVFCIGVGNEVNRVLLEQIADDSGGLAAFISRGDNFQRQAAAFRRKLTRPAASNLSVDIDGLEVSDLWPRKLPNLYHGSPIRIYGRYAKAGTARIAIRGDIDGVEFKKTTELDFPETDVANPEIDRMWAWHRIDELLKSGTGSGNQQAIVSEVVELGEEYSIVTEYTSFLVLENDGEYRRWKIDRKNARRIGWDRDAQERTRRDLEVIKNRSFANIGPKRSIETTEAPADRQLVSVSPEKVLPLNPQVAPPTGGERRSSDFQFFPGGGSSGGGSGPIGPLLVGAIFLIQKLRKRSEA